MKKILLCLLILFLVLVVWIWRVKTRPPDVPFVKASREKLVSTLPTNGKAEPTVWQAVRTEEAGLIDKVLVREGQDVRKGTVLARLSDTDLRAALDGALARLAQAQADLETINSGGKTETQVDIENQLARARFDKQAAQREFDSLRRLAQKQAATQQEVLTAQGKLSQAELEITALEQRRKALVTNSDKTVAEARLKDAEAAVELARTHITQATIRSPLSGTVYSLSVRPGSYVNVGDLISNIGQLDRLRIRVYVDEPELGRVAVGQPITITWDGLPGKNWKGAVDEMPSDIVPLGTRHVGEVLCTIGNPRHDLLPGTNVNAEIRTSEIPNALTIPKETLRREPGGAAGVFVLNDGTVHWRQVKTGTSSVTRIQILDGLAEGDSVAMPTEETLHDGERVQPVRP